MRYATADLLTDRKLAATRARAVGTLTREEAEKGGGGTTTGQRRLGGPGEAEALPSLPPPTPRCPYCAGPIEQPVARTIFQRGHRRAGGLRTETVVFCSARCAEYYQMGREG